MSSKYSTKQHTFAQLSSTHKSKISYKNIRAFLRYPNFRGGVFLGFPVYSTVQNFITIEQKKLDRSNDDRHFILFHLFADKQSIVNYMSTAS